MPIISYLFFLFGLPILWSLNHNTENVPKLCILFDQNTEYIHVETGSDSTAWEFVVVKAGFETDEKRKKALEEYFSNQRSYYPVFKVLYYSLSKPEIIYSTDSANCSTIVSVNELRSKELYSQRVYFLEQKSNQTYLVWEATLEVEE